MTVRSVFLAFVFFFASTTHAEPPALSDARHGMSCEYYHAGVRLGWMKQGGDWLDAMDKPYGNNPYAVKTISETSPVRTVEWNITDLVRKWDDGSGTVGGMYLRQLANPGSSVKFMSREVKEMSFHPRLIINWSDGTRSDLHPSADATMTCSSRKGKGEKGYFEVGNARSAIVVFPFDAKKGALVSDARLILRKAKQYGSPSEIGIFRLGSPSAQAKPAEQGLAAGFHADAAIASHPSVVFATGFESRDWQDEWSTDKPQIGAERVSRDQRNLLKPLSGQALKVTIEKGKKTGLNLLYRFREKTGSEPDAIYFRYYLRLGDNWKPRVSGKLPGLAGTYNHGGWGGRRSDGTNGWSARGRYSVSSTLAKGEYALGSYVYHAGMSKKYGSGWGWNLGPTGVIKKNQWYSIEQYVKLNSPGRHNGELKAWLDGVPVFERKDLRFRDTDDLRIETLWMNVYHGGTKKAPQDISVYIDNVVIAHDYIGPGGGVSAE